MKRFVIKVQGVAVGGTANGNIFAIMCTYSMVEVPALSKVGGHLLPLLRSAGKGQDLRLILLKNGVAGLRNNERYGTVSHTKTIL